MRILLIGGTRFVGRAIVDQLLRHGHDVTLFHRGRTNPTLFPDIEHVLGDRTTDIERLGDREWDAAIDTCGYQVEDVKPAVEFLADRVGEYAFISSIAAYEPTSQVGIDETHPVQSGEEDGDEVSWWHSDYAREKVRIERLLLETFGESRTLLLRPGMVFGPHDPVRYCIYWVARMLRGGDVLAPGDGAQPLQLIDVRDLAAFTRVRVESGIGGVYTVTGPSPASTMRSFLEAAVQAAGTEANLVWVGEQWLLRQDVHPPWERIPYWIPEPEVAGYCGMDNSRAVADGLVVTPFLDTLRDVVEWWKDDRPEPPSSRGLSAEDEQTLLREFRRAQI